MPQEQERLDMDASNEEALFEGRKKAKADQIGAVLGVILFLVVMLPASLEYGWGILVSWWSIGWMLVCLTAAWVLGKIVLLVLPDKFGYPPLKRDIDAPPWWDHSEIIGLAMGCGILIALASVVAVGSFVWTTWTGYEARKIETTKRATLSSIISSYHKNALRADEAFKDGVILSVRVRGITNQGVLEIQAGGYNHVEAQMKNTDDALSINRGDSVSLYCGHTKGSTDSLGSFIYLRDCETLKE